ncbi:peroxisomal biogenesis factor 11 [Patellaria atrata CBS 101060]|uniref:Peroxisomal biogenesis factor 11 n=1 Tax=Patellaria atrata CBS 101060 TaxID=1346257 RepID=A0A9P4VRH8_9PEZI|nr:peroxisomal biogenesis factor 11 [Patellaria atrata CBS 101060]
MVADAVIYHPSVDHYLKYVATTVGRDKLLRTIQYLSRFTAWYLFRTNHLSTSILPFETLKKQLSLTRKLLRLGKSIEHLKAAALASDSKTLDPVLKTCAVGRQLGYAAYMFWDNLTVPDAAGVWRSERAKRWQKEAYRAWFAGLLCNIVAGVYTLVQLRERERRVGEGKGVEAEGVVEGKKLVRERNATNLQLVSDVCDIMVPAFALGYANLDDGIVGLAGTLSSLIGVWSVWKKTA